MGQLEGSCGCGMPGDGRICGGTNLNFVAS
jgi:hypothetical protein